jgi:hypothetical protein
MDYQAGKLLRQVRAEISKAGGSELKALDLAGTQALFDSLQDLKQEMNEAKKQAAAEAAKPYLDAMETIEKRYALLLKLKAG